MGGIGGLSGFSSTVFPVTGQFGLAMGKATPVEKIANPQQQSANTADPEQPQQQNAKTADPEQPQGTKTTRSQPPQDAKTAALVSQLAQRDQQVRTHEAAHVAAGGMYVRGGARFSYTTGPDGRAYATGGEVSIDRSAVPGNPSATIQKLRQVQQAALAPADPSPQDRSVAAGAAMGMTQAQMELAQRQLSAYRTTASAAAPRSTGFSATA
ncbi:MAG: putative metalloprotease CJM1_0395 family protein [Candidatus Competibacteraceae bacterium]